MVVARLTPEVQLRRLILPIATRLECEGWRPGAQLDAGRGVSCNATLGGPHRSLDVFLITAAWNCGEPHRGLLLEPHDELAEGVLARPAR